MVGDMREKLNLMYMGDDSLRETYRRFRNPFYRLIRDLFSGRNIKLSQPSEEVYITLEYEMRDRGLLR